MPEMTIENALRLAAEHHREGRLREAEELYRQVLAVNANEPDALHLLGVLAGQMKQHDAAVGLIRQAMMQRPQWPEACNHLGSALKELGKFDEAQKSFEEALRYRPAFPEALLNLGNLHKARGELVKAVECYQQALALRPNYAEAFNNLGSVYQAQGELTQALEAYRAALKANPCFAEAFHNYGTAMRALGREEEAIKVFRGALSLRPDYLLAHLHLGHALRARGLSGEAAAEYQRAAELGGGAEALVALGCALDEAGQTDAAIATIEQALAARPDYAVGWANLGSVLRSKGRLDDALTAVRKAVALQPDLMEARNNLAGLLRDQGHIEEAVAAFQEALRQKPDTTTAANLLTTLHFLPASTPEMILQEARKWNAQYAAPLRGERREPRNDRSPERKLRVGYVSADFKVHASALFLEPLLKHHDREQFEIFCYAEIGAGDETTRAMQGWVDHWWVTTGETDAAVAEKIRQDGIDILVDLKLHTVGNRLLVFAHKPAPVQATWLGYPGTTGLWAMDYRLTDPYLDPPGKQNADYSEASIRLPETFWCYTPREAGLLVNELPALRNGYVTFGSLNNFCKHNEGVLALWAGILQEVKESRLMLLGEPRPHALELFSAAGIEPARIEFVPWRKRREYLELYHQIDLCLDPFPCNGHTTNFDALWMGVPFVTWPGKIVAGRVGAMQLTQVGLPELIAQSAEGYREIARSLAGDLPRLAESRAGLRKRMEGSVLMDGARFARDMESAYREMWRRWCAGSGASRI